MQETRNNSCEFLASYDIIIQSVIQPSLLPFFMAMPISLGVLNIYDLR